MEHQDYLLKIIEIIISVLRRLRQENHELKSSLGCGKTLNGNKKASEIIRTDSETV